MKKIMTMIMNEADKGKTQQKSIRTPEWFSVDNYNVVLYEEPYMIRKTGADTREEYLVGTIELCGTKTGETNGISKLFCVKKEDNDTFMMLQYLLRRRYILDCMIGDTRNYLTLDNFANTEELMQIKNNLYQLYSVAEHSGGVTFSEEDADVVFGLLKPLNEFPIDLSGQAQEVRITSLGDLRKYADERTIHRIIAEYALENTVAGDR